MPRSQAAAAQQPKPRRAAGPLPDYGSDRVGLVRVLGEVMRMRGLLASDVARAMGISPEHFSNLRRGRAGIESYAERWADVLGVDLDGEEVMDAVLEDFTRLLKQRLSDPATDTQAKVLWLDELSRSLEKRVPVRVANLYFDFLDDISPDQSKHLYVAGEPGDFPPYGVNRARRKHHRP